MKQAARLTKVVMTALVISFLAGFMAQARANDLPLAAASPLTGVAFDDRPLLLPVQRNFQMAMLTAGSELGRSCGHMEAYGWRMSQTEQGRVNQIFNNTVDRLRLLGYGIAPQTLTSVANDITLFTADRPDKHFIFLWSAGELGLVMTLCETSAPLTPAKPISPLVPSVQVFPMQTDVVASHLDTLGGKGSRNEAAENFTPLGEWVGSYTCAQGYTGGSLQITHANGKDFEGVFKFYATPRNPTVPAGAYNVYGQYDKESKRILINPGQWIKRPPNYYNTVMVGSFDPFRDTFSAYFQGISGCTSFEAKRAGEPYVDTGAKKKHKKPAAKKKPVAKKKPGPKPVAPSSSSLPTAPMPIPPTPPASATPQPAPAIPASPPPASVPVSPASPPPAPSSTSAAPAAGSSVPLPSSDGISVAPPAK